MTFAQLTHPAHLGHSVSMRGKGRKGRLALAYLAAASGTMLAGGCITVNAPDKPIVIELNINITQEVIYRLADDVRENIEANPEIF